MNANMNSFSSPALLYIRLYDDVQTILIQNLIDCRYWSLRECHIMSIVRSDGPHPFLLDINSAKLYAFQD
jgi:hypothetical protein